MAAGRSLKSLVSRRRRADEEGEDEDGPMVVQDSQSEGSVLSDAEDEEGDASSLDEPARDDTGVQERGGAQAGVIERAPAEEVRSLKKKGRRSKDRPRAASQAQSKFNVFADTEAMMNGLHIDEEEQAVETLEFQSHDTMPAKAASSIPGLAVSSSGHTNSPGGSQRREHDEYKKKRDANPAFIPNRGNFFMHDSRGTPNGQPSPPVRGAWQGRGRGRGMPSSRDALTSASPTARTDRGPDQLWKHDLHETINEEAPPPVSRPARSQPHAVTSTNIPVSAVVPQVSMQTPKILSFSSTTLVGKVSIKVYLAGMKAPIIIADAPVKHYVRLPNHRPPLRRDKPIRVSLQGHPQRYIFPSPERSFIFIPRQLRPSQQGYGRAGYQRHVGGYGYSSRRTSMYGGSMYSASVAASRRSSMAAVSRGDAFSPASFANGMSLMANRPMVRLPHGNQSLSAVTTPSGPLSGQHTPTNFPQLHTYPLPQQPMQHGTPTTTMHHPHPQKAISVTGIESPAVLQQAPQTNEPQPFQDQLPSHMNEQLSYGQPPLFYSPNQQYQYPQQLPAGTPQSGVPDHALHAQRFPSSATPYGQTQYFVPYPTQPNYFYSPSAPSGYPPMPLYGQPLQSYALPPAVPLQMQQLAPQQQPIGSADEQPQAQAHLPPTQSQSGMVAHESNGMVFYMPASEAQQQPQAEQYQPAESFVPSYAMPGLPPPTPAPEGPYFYPQMSVQSGAFYPSQA